MLKTLCKLISTCEVKKQILSWFPTVTEEILAVNEAAVHTNTKKTSKLALTASLFTNKVCYF